MKYIKTDNVLLVQNHWAHYSVCYELNKEMMYCF